MSHVIELRRRIKAVELIQKTTHAMRLTSMSTHARLHKKQAFLTQYRQEIENTIAIVKQGLPVAPVKKAAKGKELTIIVGSQKGLCGAFNTRLFRYFEQEYKAPKDGKLIAIGKRMIENLIPEHTLLYSFETFNPANFFAVTSELCEHMLKPGRYSKVTLFGNEPVSFFLQRPIQTTVLMPQQYTASQIATTIREGETHRYEQNPYEMLAYLERLLTKVHIEEILFQSLIAEQAARFISMDASTTNAEKILETMKRDYNKLRQASITRELMDLIGGML